MKFKFEMQNADTDAFIFRFTWNSTDLADFARSPGPGNPKGPLTVYHFWQGLNGVGEI